jgi:hypothetical protein
MNSPLPPVNLLALVLALMTHYYFLAERKMPEKPEGMSEKTPEFRPEEQPPTHKERQPQPIFYQNPWE